MHGDSNCYTLQVQKGLFLYFRFLNLLFIFQPIAARRNTAVTDRETMIHYIKTKSFIIRFLILNPILCWHITSARSGSFDECRAEPFVLLTGIKGHSIMQAT